MVSFKQQINQQFALIAQSLASPQRLEILDYLAQSSYSVNELSQLTNLSIANTSRHLQILKQSSLVVVISKGKERLYHLVGDDIIQLIDYLRKTAETHLAEMRSLTNTYLTKKEELEAINANELLKKIKKNEVIILDIRPEKEFLAGHLPNAINVPPNEIVHRIDKLNNKKTVVAYCRGPYCLYSYQAVQVLQEKGFNAKRLEYGFPEWKAQNHPILT